MDARIQESIESAYAIEKEYGFLCDAQSRSTATFVAVDRLAETQDLAILDGCPEWLQTELDEWVAYFERTGQFGFISNLGEVDHSDLMRRVAPLFKRPRGAP